MALTRPDIYNGWIDKPKGVKINDVIVIDNVAHRIHKVVVHRFRLGDVEDPDLYAAEPIINWQNSEMGKWVMEKSVEVPEWHRHLEPMTYDYQYAIVAFLKDVDYTFWTLKWGSTV